MKNKTIKISIRIILLFVTAIFLSFIPDYLFSFFGDWYCSGSGDYTRHDYIKIWQKCDYTDEFHLQSWHWGYRHWLYLSMGICLAIIQIADVFILINKTTQK